MVIKMAADTKSEASFLLHPIVVFSVLTFVSVLSCRVPLGCSASEETPVSKERRYAAVCILFF
jgi:hypothetical protein